MDEPLTVDNLRSTHELMGVTVLRLEAEVTSIGTSEPESQGEGANEVDEQNDEPENVSVLPLNGYLAVTMSGTLTRDDVELNVLMYAQLRRTGEDVPNIDAERDQESLKAFGTEIARSVLAPRLEGLAGGVRGVVGPMVLVPDDFSSRALVVSPSKRVD